MLGLSSTDRDIQHRHKSAVLAGMLGLGLVAPFLGAAVRQPQLGRARVGPPIVGGLNRGRLDAGTIKKFPAGAGIAVIIGKRSSAELPQSSSAPSLNQRQ
jgi:hypothetical protein